MNANINTAPIEVRDLRRREFFMTDDEYLNGYARHCGIYATGVYMSLCRHSNKAQQSFPSISLIAYELDISRDSVIRALKKLVEYNIITIEKVLTEKGEYRNNIYTLIEKTNWKVLKEGSSSQRPRGSSPQRLGSSSQRPRVVADSDTKETHKKGTHITIGLQEDATDGKEEKIRRKTVVYPKESYELILNEYQRLKNIKLQGNEFQPVQQTIKSMLMDGRTLEQILSVMNWLQDSPVEWTDNWTMRTVRMKLPELIAKIGEPRELSEEERAFVEYEEKRRLKT